MGDLVLFGIWSFVVATVGGVVGLVLGNLRLPMAVAIAPTAAAATGANLAVSAASAASAAIGHLRAGRVDWRTVRWMLPPSVLAAFAGGYLAGRIAERPLLILIVCVLVWGAWELLRPAPSRRPPRRRLDPRVSTVAIGAGVGFLGGVVGLILGSLRMPALIRVLGHDPARAVGSNHLVGAALGVAGLLGHLAGGPVAFDLAVAGMIGGVPGGLLGARLTGRLSRETLLRAIAGALLISAASLSWRILGGG